MDNGLRVTFIERKESEHVDEKLHSRHLENDDMLLWKAFKNGSESAFITIYKQYFQILYNFGRQLSGDPDLIKDCIQDVFITLRKSRKNLAEVSSIKAYLLKSIRHRIIRELKRSKRRNEWILLQAPLDFQIEPSTENLIIDRQFQEHQIMSIANALTHLSNRQKEAIYYYYYNDLSYEEIKEVMGFSSTEAARNLIYRSLSAIRNRIKQK